MDNLESTTLELWPNKVEQLVHAKKLSVGKLNAKFTNIVFPWDDRYERQRQLFCSQIQEKPLFIIFPISEKELLQIYKLLENHKLTVRIVGGRHSTVLQNPDIFVIMANFNNIKLDKNIFQVGTGNTQGHITNYLFKHFPHHYFPGAKPNHPNSSIFPGGSAASVGICGISSVGGVGTLRRTVGLTLDSIQSMRITIPPTSDRPARTVTTSKEANSDLFWAIRGGGAANFGLVTEINFKIVKVHQVILYEIHWNYNPKTLRKVLKIWQNTAIYRSNQFNEDLSISTCINSDCISQGLNLLGIYVLHKNQNQKSAIQDIENAVQNLGGKLIISPITDYSTVYDKFANSRIYHNFSLSCAVFTMNSISSKTVLERMDSASKIIGSCYIGLQLMGGKIAEVSSKETAFYPRKAKFFIDIFCFWDSIVYQEENIKWNKKTFAQFHDVNNPIDSYCYLGFPIQTNPPINNANYYGKNLDRLTRIKKRMDPLGLLTFPGSL